MPEYKAWALHDVHCHVDLFPRPERIAKEAEKKKVPTIAVTNCPSHYKLAREHLQMMHFVKPALGFHPGEVANHQKELKLFEEFAPSCRFIGEIGLDYSRCSADVRKAQRESFDCILRALSSSTRFISLHSRGSENDVLEMLNEYGIKHAVFHWYTGSESTLSAVLDAGHFLSVNPQMVKSKSGSQIIKQTPRNRILLESDGPYVRMRNTPVTPWGTIDVINKLSEYWDVDEESAISICSLNLQTILQQLRLIEAFGSAGDELH